MTVYLEPIPNIFKFMARSNEIVSDFSGDTVYDLFIAQDCGDTGRLGGAAHFFEQAKHTVCVDHHISNQSFAQDNYIFPQASSASELFYELLQRSASQRRLPSAFIPEWCTTPASSSIRVRRERRWRSPER